MFWSSDKWPEPGIHELRKRSRILVIDDQGFVYNDLFVRDGYNIEVWTEVKDLSRLERGEYDVILLDLQGVGQKESAEQGLGVLKHIKGANPAQIVVAFSNADWPLKYQSFFKMADGTLSKSADYVDFKKVVDDCIQKRFSASYYVQKIVEIGGASVADPSTLRSKAEKAILARKPSILEKYLAKVADDPKLVERVVNVAKIAVGLWESWKKIHP